MKWLVFIATPLFGVSNTSGGPPDPGEPFQITAALGALSAFTRSDDHDGEFCQYNDSQQITSGDFLLEYFLRECGGGEHHALAESALAAGPDTGSFQLSQSSHAATRSEGFPDIADASSEAVSDIDLELEYATKVDITWSVGAEGRAFSHVQVFDPDSQSVLLEAVSTDGETEVESGLHTLWMDAGIWKLSVFTSSHAGSPDDGDSPDSVAVVELFMQVVTEDLLGDLTGDLRVDGQDLAVLLGSWGRCQDACIADLDDSGAVDGADLSILLGAWTS